MLTPADSILPVVKIVPVELNVVVLTASPAILRADNPLNVGESPL